MEAPYRSVWADNFRFPTLPGQTWINPAARITARSAEKEKEADGQGSVLGCSTMSKWARAG
jgi:hypothetical protein